MPVSKKRRTHPKRKKTGSQRRQRVQREREISCIAVAYEPSFAWLQARETLPYSDYESYLEGYDEILDSLRAQGDEIYLTAFDHDEYLLYCLETGQDPDSAESRSAYTTDQLQNGNAHYWEESVSEFLEAVELEESGWTEKDYVKAAAVAEDLSDELHQLITAASLGVSTITLATTVAQRKLVLDAHYNKSSEGLQVSEGFAEVHGRILDAIVRSGGLTLRTPTGVVLPDGTVQERVRGWHLGNCEVVELDEAAVFSAYCTDAGTGEPLPPEHGVLYG